MNKLLAIHLWKEIRASRQLLIALLIMLSVIILVIPMIFGDLGSEPSFFALGLTTSILVAIAVFGTEFIISEARGRKVDFLLRSPGGRIYPFAAKSILMLAIPCAFGLYFYFISQVTRICIWHKSWTVLSDGMGISSFEFISGSILALSSAGWLLAATCWVPRIEKALLTWSGVQIVFLYAGLGDYFSGYTIVCTLPGLALFALINLIAGFSVAALSYIGGNRYGPAPGRALMLGAPLAILFIITALIANLD